MGVSSVALNERGGDNEEDIEPEDEDDSQLRESSRNLSEDKEDSKMYYIECKEGEDSSLLISHDRPVNISEKKIEMTKEGQRDHHQFQQI